MDALLFLLARFAEKKYCKIVKEMLSKKNIGYEIVDAEENGELCDAYGVTQAPTLVVIEENGFEKFANASNIIRYLNS